MLLNLVQQQQGKLAAQAEQLRQVQPQLATWSHGADTGEDFV